MKTGKTLTQLAQALEEQKRSSKDFIVPTELLTAAVDRDNKVSLRFNEQEFSPNTWSHSQLSSFGNIPKAYYDRISQENPDLLADNINHAIRMHPNESRLIRTVDGKARAVLSSRYRILDSHDMLESVFPLFMEKGLEVVSSELTDQRMFIKVLSPSLRSDITGKGDMVQYGLTISSSDVGSGSVKVEPLVYRLVCLNGMISNTAFRKYHVGKNQHEDSIQELLSDKTKAVSDAAFWMQVNDIIKHSLDPKNFETQVDRLRAAAGRKIDNFDLPKVVELTMKTVGITGDVKKNSILSALASGNQGAGLTQWGLINSFTAAAKDDRFSYEESIELERAGGSIIELSKSQWSTISEAA